jgi:FkbM family methyltransferase
MLKASEELRLDADAHEQEVITNDSYGLKSFAETHKDVEYVVDIGANIGAFSVHAHNIFPNAKIISCEPESSMMDYLRENTDNKLIYIEAAIVGDPNLRDVEFSICKWQGNHHVKGKFDMETFGRPEIGSEILYSRTVPAITLEAVVDLAMFPRIDLLKIDTEGSEPDILEGAKDWLKNIKYIMGEWHSQKDLIRIKEVLKDTHDTVYTDGVHFKDVRGEVANGGFTAVLKVLT